MIWPTAHEIATAIVASARLAGYDPAALRAAGRDPTAYLMGGQYRRHFIYAFAALAHRFPEIPLTTIPKMLGVARLKCYPFTADACLNLRGFGKTDWCNLDDLNTVVAACGWPAMTAEEMKCYRAPPARRNNDGRQAESNASVIVDDLANRLAADMPGLIAESPKGLTHGQLHKRYGGEIHHLYAAMKILARDGRAKLVRRVDSTAKFLVPADSADPFVPDLTSAQQSALDAMIGSAGPDGVTAISRKQIAAHMHCGVGNIDGHLSALIRKGKIERLTKGDPTTTSTYRIIGLAAVEQKPPEPAPPMDVPKFPVRPPAAKAALSDLPAKPTPAKAPSARAGGALTVGPDMSPETAGNGPGFRAKPTGGGGMAFAAGALDIRYKPDAPLRGRPGVIVLTEEFCGDPPAGRSALAQRQAEEAERARRTDD